MSKGVGCWGVIVLNLRAEEKKSKGGGYIFNYKRVIIFRLLVPDHTLSGGLGRGQSLKD